MDHPTITTVIPTYRRPKLIRRAIESVLVQTYRNVQVCVHDNASDDETEAAVREYARHDQRVQYFKNPSNVGAVRNVIKGIAAVTTDHYSLLSDDDFLLPSFYEEAISAFQEYPEIGFACAPVVKIDLLSGKVSPLNGDWQTGLYAPSVPVATRMMESHFVSTGVVFRKNIRELIGCFDLSGNDRLYMTLASAAVPFMVLSGIGAGLTLHPASHSNRVGLAGTGTSLLYAAKQEAVEHIVQLKISDIEKANLLMLTENEFATIFDVKRYLRLVSAADGDDDNIPILSSPACGTFYGSVARAFGILPPSSHAFLAVVAKIINRLRSIRYASSRDARWESLSDEMVAFLNYGKGDLAALTDVLVKMYPAAPKSLRIH
jgi:glycosyltransferase involved in cell wall biosynthesis